MLRQDVVALSLDEGLDVDDGVGGVDGLVGSNAYRGKATSKSKVKSKVTSSCTRGNGEMDCAFTFSTSSLGSIPVLSIFYLPLWHKLIGMEWNQAQLNCVV